jgi:hydrogenase/urease accessory protein HupE
MPPLCARSLDPAGTPGTSSRVNLRLCVLFALTGSLSVARAEAHDEKVSTTQVVVSGRSLTLSVDVGLIGLEKVVRLPAPPAQITEAEIDSVRDEIVAFLRTGLAVSVNGRLVIPEKGKLSPIYEPFILSGEPYIARVRQEFRVSAEDEIRNVGLVVRFYSDITDQHRAVIQVRWGDSQREFVRVGPGTLDLTRARVDPSFWGTAGDFLLWGSHHIFIGYDHIAFLLALLLGARRLREVVILVTSFTVAHSLTLALAALDLIRISPQITEALIAGSIVYVASENYWIQNARHRWILTFAFGLVHGLGFSGVLRERLFDATGLALPVVSFNVGVELGQIAILLPVYPMFAALRRGATPEQGQMRHQRLVRIGSAPILLLGIGWLAERLTGWTFMPF